MFAQSMKLFLLFTLVSLCLTGCQSNTNEKKIGIIVPLENKSLDEIVNGFVETLRKQSPVPVQFKVANAQGDMNVQRAIIQQMKSEHLAMIVPIGTTATQMTVAMIPTQSIVSLAANFTEADRATGKVCHTAVVHDEISSQQLLDFIHQAYPTLTQLTLIHSASDKIFPEVKNVVAIGKTMGITIKPMMMSSLNELYSLTNALPNGTQGILILKDILIASGISTLEKVAAQRHIPLITSDQGTVQEGATFALGVHEREIGVEGAQLAAAILAGKAACALPIVNMTRLTVFINQSALRKTNQSVTPLQQAADKHHYAVEFVEEARESR